MLPALPTCSLQASFDTLSPTINTLPPVHQQARQHLFECNVSNGQVCWGLS